MIVQFGQWKCSIQLYRYAGGRIAIQLYDLKDGHPVATASVNLPEFRCPEGHTFIKDCRENTGILLALKNAGIVEDTGVRVPAGYGEAALVKILLVEDE